MDYTGIWIVSLVIFVQIILYNGLAEGRSVPALQDLCTRLPQIYVCTLNRVQDRPVPPPVPIPLPSSTVSPEPVTFAAPTTQSPAVGLFCDQNDRRYNRLCKQKEWKRDNFLPYCQQYESICFMTTIFPSKYEVMTGTTLRPRQVELVRNYQPPPVSQSNPGPFPSLRRSNTGSAGGGAYQDNNYNPGYPSGPVGSYNTPAVGDAGGQYGGSPQYNSRPSPLSSIYPNGIGGIGFGRGVQAPFFSGMGGTYINPLSGVGRGTSLNAAGIPISFGRGVSYGGIMPFGLGGGGSGIGMFGR